VETLFLVMPPAWLVRAAVAGVWVYEGLWCKILGREKNQEKIVENVPKWGKAIGLVFLKTLGWVELAIGLWALSGWAAGLCALTQTVLLVTLNTNGLLWSRHLIHDPPGMVFKNSVLLVLAWVSAGLAGMGR
jgi:hypothetical protein